MYKESLKFSVVGIQHNLQDVRQVATKCIVELYRVMGDSIRNSLTELRPAQLEQVESAISEVNPGLKRGGIKE